ncbi:MAG: Na/Pi symporter [Verrucomicrobiales bacterium]|nr:Na/Pi symporter [Verrucomicrobiales bacterium]
MLRKILLPLIFLLLAYGFWVSQDFKEIAAGVSIFLFGMLSLEEGFKVFTGGVLERLLKKTTDKKWKSLGFGMVATSVMQSSSLVSVITISFLSAGLIPLIAGVGIIFGANLGTTTGAWLVAAFGLKVKISAYAMPMIVFGVILIFQKAKALRGVGYILSGLGFLFLGIHHMKAGFETFALQFDLTAYSMTGYPGVFLFVALGILATVIMQSSHATLVIVITALGANQVTYENALALAIGANIGTTVTAIIGSLGANVTGRQLAAAHLIFNATTALVAIGFIYQLTGLVDKMSGSLGIGKEDYTMKLAVFHTVFNALGIIFMLPFMNPMVRFLERVIRPHRGALAKPRYLTEAATELSDTVIEAMRKETLNLFNYAFAIICEGLRLTPADVVAEGSLKAVIRNSSAKKSINIDERYENEVKSLYSEIVVFSSKAQSQLTPHQTEELYDLRNAGRSVIGAVKATKHLQKNLDLSLQSQEEVIRKEYYKIQLRLAKVLREIDRIRREHEEDNENSTTVSLDALLAEVQHTCKRRDKRLDKLIRKKAVSAAAATSLMNDFAYAATLSQELLEVASTLFSPRDINDNFDKRSALLEMNAMSEAQSGPTPGRQSP